MFKVGICFSRTFKGNDPLGHIGEKLPVYLRLLDFCQEEGWEIYILTRRTYLGNGVFAGVWQYQHGKFFKIDREIKMDLVYDRTGGIEFPLRGDNLKVVNNLDFKILAWDKFKTFKEIGEYMPRTVWLEDLDKITTDWVVAKPYNGMEGVGIFIGPKKFLRKDKLLPGKKYVVQEFVDTSEGLAGITPGLHDLRVVIVNVKVVWCHVRTPATGKMLANRAQGGTLTEIDYAQVPESVKKIVKTISRNFFQKYDNPIFSLDFGMGKDGIPKIFEINDQIGFPRREMKNRDNFLSALIENFKSKLKTWSNF